MKLFGRKDWNYHNFNRKTKSFYNENGDDIHGFDKKGHDKNGDDIHGFDIKGIHKKTKTKFDQDGYDVKRFDEFGYGKDGFDIDRFDKKGYDTHGIHKVTGKNYYDTLTLELPPDAGTGYPYGKKRRGRSDGSVYREVYSQAVYREYITTGGILTIDGYNLYLSLLHVAGKDTVHGAPKKKSDMFVPYATLSALGYIIHSQTEREYYLSSNGHVCLELLARTFSNSAIPDL